MNRVFNFEGPVFTFLSRLADLFWLNLLYILCCIPVISAGAATTAMYYVTLKMAKNEEGYITRSFFKSFKENFVQATLMWLAVLLVVFILFIDLRIAGSGSIPGTSVKNVVTVAVGVMAIIVSMILMYLFPLLAQFDNTVKNTIRNAFLISIRHLPYTVLMMILTVLPVALIWFFPALLLIVVIMFSATAYIKSGFLNRIFELYMPDKDNTEDSSDPAEGINGEG